MNELQDLLANTLQCFSVLFQARYCYVTIIGLSRARYCYVTIIRFVVDLKDLRSQISVHFFVLFQHVDITYSEFIR